MTDIPMNLPLHSLLEIVCSGLGLEVALQGEAVHSAPRALLSQAEDIERSRLGGEVLLHPVVACEDRKGGTSALTFRLRARCMGGAHR